MNQPQNNQLQQTRSAMVKAARPSPLNWVFGGQERVEA
jgi:hypothetical protein